MHLSEGDYGKKADGKVYGSILPLHLMLPRDQFWPARSTGEKRSRNKMGEDTLLLLTGHSVYNIMTLK